MRALETIPHPSFLISIMYMNNKYILRIEAGPYEQIYKFTKEMAPDIETVKRIANHNLIQEAKNIFDKMQENLVANYQQ